MKDIFPNPDAVSRYIEHSLTDAYWESQYNPAPRLFPEENESIYGSKKGLPSTTVVIDSVIEFLNDNNSSAEEVVDVCAIVRSEFGVNFSKYETVKTSLHQGTYYWLCLSKNNILDLISYSPLKRKFEASWKVSNASLYLYLQQCVPSEIQPIFMYIDKTTFDHKESLIKCLAAWVEVHVDQAQQIIQNASQVTSSEVMYSR